MISPSQERVVQVRALAWDTALCCWARHFTLTVSLSTQEYLGFSHDVTKIHTTKLHVLTLLRLYFYDVQEQLESTIHEYKFSHKMGSNWFSDR